MKIYAYPFRGYWRDVSSLRDYFEANLDMARVSFRKKGRKENQNNPKKRV